MSQDLAPCKLFPAPAELAVGARFSAKTKTTKTTTRC